MLGILTEDFELFNTALMRDEGPRGGVVVKALATNRQVAGSIPDGVIGFFQ